LPSQKVPYLFGRGQAPLLPAFLKRLELHSKKIFLISNPTVFTLHGEGILNLLRDVGKEPIAIEVPEGETAKSLVEAENLYKSFCNFQATRHTIVIALGGGVITDLAGFIASTFMRGLPLILVPTTLLAQADAAIGGKTAVNLPEGKNLVGTFYHPKLVLIDPEFLKTLNQREYRNGLAEIVKMTLLAGEKKFRALERLQNPEGPLLDPFLLLAIKKKLSIVEKDPFEKRERMLLNLGHTFAHALESAGNYEAYTHGEAVSIGLIGACRLSEKFWNFPQKTTQRIEKLLSRLGLPVRYRGIEPWAILEKMQRDKKKGERLRFILLKEIGDARIEDNVPEKLVLEVLESLMEG